MTKRAVGDRPRFLSLSTQGGEGMKSIIFSLALVLAAFGIIPSALAADGGNAFVDATYGETVSGAATNQSGWAAGGGYLWKLDDESSVGFEVGYMHFGHVVDNSNP